MLFSKKWKGYLFGCLVFMACKSADCGCPMAEAATVPIEEIQNQENKLDQREWTKITKK